ncbi:hypothetical protein [Caproiciproducens sp. MSJ-32]|uniref:hypothetical protein n=1 Tax=Caproiciproducens sp. MSJ-32 TaxID=2841527 RepID=UPI002571305B|nr:hypothetical protein [Caproiciproducens sp. MSJ-32]
MKTLLIPASKSLTITNKFPWKNFNIDLISPLKEDFNKYTTYYNPPAYYRHKRIPFYPITSKIAISTDITPIVCDWIINRKNNKLI